MPRTVIPPSPSLGLKGLALDVAISPAPGAGSLPSSVGVAGGGDKFPDKLVKYVPAETLAFFVPTAAAIGTGHRWLLLAALVAGAVGTPCYLWLSAHALPKEQRPLLHFYVLAVLAFACWAIGISPTSASLVHLEPAAAGVILLFAVFLIPLIDGVLTALLGPTAAIHPVRSARAH